MGNTETNNELPDTLTPLSLTQEQKEIKLPWGRLYSCVDKLNSVDLIGDNLSLGRSETCTAVVCLQNYPSQILLNISRLQFTITRDEHTKLVYLKDHSKNGTFVNYLLVGKGNKNILQHDDLLSVGLRGQQKLFIFKLLEIDESNKYLPDELKTKYKLSRFLGKGACGEVHLVFETTTTKAFAVKKIRKGIYATGSTHHLNHPDKIMNEVKILQLLDHPCVINMREIVETETDVFLVLEYMGGGELTKRILSIQPMTEQNIKFLFYQMALAVQYLHSEGITHRDLKPDNVLLASDATETIVKITDFGLSKFIAESTIMDTLCGTPTYVAPEIIDGSYSEYSKKVDVWSLGVILFFMLCKEVPFKSSDRGGLNKMILKGQYQFDPKKWQGVSSSAKDLVKKMLVVDPENRLTMNRVLAHPWLSKDIQMQYRVSELMKADMFNGDYFIDDSDVDSSSEEPSTKKSKLQETTV